MDREIKRLAPEPVWAKFAEILRVPRPSFHEEAIREYLLNEARSHGIECKADEAGNVILRKPATGNNLKPVHFIFKFLMREKDCDAGTYRQVCPTFPKRTKAHDGTEVSI